VERADEAPGRSWDWAQARARCLREARRVLGPTPAAEDAVQEALLRGWLKRARCRDADGPLPWLARIARNEALRLRARETRHAHAPFEDEVLAVTGDSNAVDDAATRIDAQRMVAGLRPVDRELVRLHYLEDLTQAEAAKRLGMAGATAKVRLHRLRARLRRQLSAGDEGS
jgi:RNA polymerase sigma-70 factor (ECF subfamily)